MDMATVLKALDEFCQSQAPGTVIPSHPELMRRFQASERSVRWSIEELVRQGKISRRHGARTRVADFPRGASGNGHPPTESLAPDSARHTVVAIAQPDHAFFDHALQLLADQTERAGLSLVCRPYNRAVAGALRGERPLGYLLFGRAMAGLATQLQGEGKRVVLVATPAAGESFEVPHVHGDQQKGGYLVTRHLIESGHRRIAIDGVGDAENRSSPRVLGHLRAVAEAQLAGLSVESSFVPLDRLKVWKENPSMALEFWRGDRAPTAIAAWNDRDALRYMGFLSYAGIRIPEQVSVVGYDNLPDSEHCHPSLTTIDPAVETQLETALDMLQQEQDLDPRRSVIVVPHLIARASSGNPSS